MAYHTGLYLFIFLPFTVLVYQIFPRRMRSKVLLLASYLFFFIISKELIIYLLGTTLFTHYIGIYLAWLKLNCTKEIKDKEKSEITEIKKQYKQKQKKVLTFGIITLLAVLGYLKYYNFFAENMNILFKATGTGNTLVLPIQNLLLPIGISFYTLQAIGYMADVYWDKILPEKNLTKLALFLGFFPQIMEGPISMYSQTADALCKGEPIKLENLSKGCIRILWGLFKKMIIADRLYRVVQVIFTHYENYSGIVIIIAAIAYTTQLYMEFSGCMDIVIGSGKLFGITLPENFRQPFISKNAAEFWRRWHITLGVWFKTYVFYPVSVSGLVKKWNKFGKKHLGKYITKLGISAMALFPVWFFNGLWHGAQWNYLFYGMYYFFLLLAGIALEPVRNHILKTYKLNEDAWYWKIPQLLKTWGIIFTGELFFRANTLTAGFGMFGSIFKNFSLNKLWDGTLLTFGLDKADYLIVIIGCIVVTVVGTIKERHLLGEQGLLKLHLPLRWMIYYGLILAVVVFGAYGVGYQQVDLIYAGF